MFKLELTKRQLEVLTNAMQCYTNDTETNLEFDKDYHGQEDHFGEPINRKEEIAEAAGELRVCKNILEKLQGDRYFY
jgi:hypothetical protein